MERLIQNEAELPNEEHSFTQAPCGPDERWPDKTVTLDAKKDACVRDGYEAVQYWYQYWYQYW